MYNNESRKVLVFISFYKQSPVTKRFFVIVFMKLKIQVLNFMRVRGIKDAGNTKGGWGIYSVTGVG